MRIHRIIGEGLYPYELPVEVNDDPEKIERIKQFFDANIAKVSKWIFEPGHTEGFLKPYPEIEFKILRSSSIEAGATLIQPNVYVIYISYAALVFIYDLFNRMLSYRNILPEIGNPDEEELESPSLINYGILEPSGVIPKNNVRRQFAAMLIDQAILFMFQHEHYHILNGHVDLKFNEYKERTYSEFKKTTLDPLTERTLEMDADSCSVCWIMRTTINLFSNHRPELLPLSIDKAVEYCFFSTYSLMRLCYGREQILVNPLIEFDQTISTHPSWRLRQYMAVETGLKYIETIHNDKINTDIFPGNVAKTLLTAEKIYETMTGLKPVEMKEQLPHLLHFSSPQTKEFLDHWKVIKIKLERIAYLKLVD